MELLLNQDSRIHLERPSDQVPNKSTEVINSNTHQLNEAVDFYSDSSQITTSEYLDAFESTNLHSNQEQFFASLADDIERMSLISQSTTANSPPYLTTSVFGGSNQLTPTSKILSHSNVDPESRKRSFSRFKQTGELVNTERVYLAALEILKNDYIDAFMSDISTPVFFETFNQCISNMINNHQALYFKLKTVYLSWANKCLNLSATNKEEKQQQLKSPTFSIYHYLPQNLEREYMQQIIQLLERDAIDVSSYGEYCALFNRIVSFAVENNIEKYKRNSIVISDDSFVPQRDSQNEVFVDQRIDTRFISVVQMPTNRITRYKLILQSLLKNIDLDETSDISNTYKQAASKLGEFVDNVNHYVGESNQKFEQLDTFKKIYDGKIPKLNPKASTSHYTKCPLNSMFFDNLGYIKLTGAFLFAYHDDDLNKIISHNVIATFFDSHLILGKPSLIYNGKAEIILALPLTSVINLPEQTSKLSSGNRLHLLATEYESTMNISFENDFKVYEAAFVFINNEEMNIWKECIFNGVKKAKSVESLDEWHFSTFQEKVKQSECGSQLDKFNSMGYIPLGMTVFKSKLGESSNVFFFDVDTFLDKRGSISSSSTNANHHIIINKKSRSAHHTPNTPQSQLRDPSVLPIHSQRPIVKITIQERVAAQTCLGDLWSPLLFKYELTMESSSTFGTLGRSFSNFFFRNDDNGGVYDEESDNINLSLGKTLKNSDSFASLTSFLVPSAVFGGDGHSISDISRSPFRQLKHSRSKMRLNEDSDSKYQTLNQYPQTPRTPKASRCNSSFYSVGESPMKFSLERVFTRNSMQSVKSFRGNKRLDYDIPTPQSPIKHRKRNMISRSLGMNINTNPTIPPHSLTRAQMTDEIFTPKEKLDKGGVISISSSDTKSSSKSGVTNFFKGVFSFRR